MFLENLLGCNPFLQIPEIIREPEKVLEKIRDCALNHFNCGELNYFDPVGGNDQCHLAAYRVAKMYNEKEGQGENLDLNDHKFLTLSFLLSLQFLIKPDLFSQLLFIEDQQEVENLQNFKKYSLGAAQSSLAEETRRYIHEMIRGLGDQSEETSELERLLLNEDLNRGKNGIFRYPKFAGAVLLSKALEQNPMPIAEKIGEISQVVFLEYLKQPAIVFQGTSREDGFAFDFPKMLLAEAADFSRKKQKKETKQFFSSFEGSYPKLAASFSEYPKDSEKSSLEIGHVFCGRVQK